MFSWRWVNKALYGDLLVKYREAVKMDNASWWALREEVSKERSRYDNLLEKYHALKIQGAAPEPAPPPVMTPKAPDPVYEAITAAAGADRGLRASMSREAQRYRAMHIPDIEIIRRIQGGESDEELFGAPAESMTH